MVRSRDKRWRRSGTVLPFLLLSLSVIVGIVALGMDGGRMLEERRHGQSVADAAALAAAADLYQNWWTYKGSDPSGTAKNAALKIAAANGYTNDGTTSIVTVNVPPSSGAFAGKPEYVEVVVEYKLARNFAAIFTGKSLQVKARAVALGRPAKIGIICLRSTGADAFLNQSLLFTVLGNPIYVNSTDPAAFDQKSFGVILASSYQVAGGYINPGGALMLGSMNTGVEPTADPLQNLPVPGAGVTRSAVPVVINSLLPTILQPGVYQGGIQIKGASIVIMNPGVYIMQGGGFQVSGLATVAGLGVTIYNTTDASNKAGAISVTGLGKLVITAPTSGTYQGISVFQDRSVSQAITISGVGLAALGGTVYAPAAAVNLSSLAPVGLIDTLGGAYICSSMQVSGIGSINIDLGNNPPAVPDVNLVE
jgi:hypothetical protein